MRRGLVVGIAGLLGAAAVIAGAFGAHALRDHVTPARLASWETAVRYQMYHAVALLVLASGRRAPRSGVAGLWMLGTLLFSGSLYLLVATDTPSLGAVTPFGGVALIAGWLVVAVDGLRSVDDAPSEITTDELSLTRRAR
ncbi:MAG: DUF423 domain-containing protein [Myxococcales bacterium]|nr:DUF423 domain-containing protein [Myxococcales bacterium]